jgi:magnesium chelatase family protein
LVALVSTVAFLGLEARAIEVQVQVTPGLPAFIVVGLPDKAVGESRERVRGALAAIGLALPPKRITVNLSPADLPKEGSHYDLPIALGLLGAMGVVDAETLAGHVVVGELGLDARIMGVPGVLLAALHARRTIRGWSARRAGAGSGLGRLDRGGRCARSDGAARSFPRRTTTRAPAPGEAEARAHGPDLSQVKGQESAKRALEIAAAGGHNLLMAGPPGSGKSLMAACLPGILPPISRRPRRSKCRWCSSVAGTLQAGRLSRTRPFRAPHHSASMAALVGGGLKFARARSASRISACCSSTNCPNSSARCSIRCASRWRPARSAVARANGHVTFPARVQLVAAMNPCKCGHLGDAARACSRAPRCAADYQARVSGPLLDRIDLHVEVAAVSAADLVLPPPAEGSAEVPGAWVRRAISRRRAMPIMVRAPMPKPTAHCSIRSPRPTNPAARCWRRRLRRWACRRAAYTRVLRVARTIADLAGAEQVGRVHVAEALSYRLRPPTN